MKQRIITACGLVALLTLLFLTKQNAPIIFDIGIVLLAIVAGYEMSELLKKIGYYNNKWCIIAYPVVSYILYRICFAKKISLLISIIMQIALILIICAGLALYHIFRKKLTDNEIKTRKLKCSIEQFSIFKGIQTVFGIIYPCFIIMLLVLINNLKLINYTVTKFAGYEYAVSLFLLIYTFAVPVFVDTFAMFTGSIFKGKKLCERISPNKTISGAIGGLVWGTLGSILIFAIFNAIDAYNMIFQTIGFAWWQFLILGIIASVLCQIGDIFESFLKRKANVKDSGNILPGHGGVLDRIDSHIANIIIVFVFILLI